MKDISNTNNLTIINTNEQCKKNVFKDYFITIKDKQKYFFLKTIPLNKSRKNTHDIDIEVLEQEDTYNEFLDRLEIEKPNHVIVECKLSNDFFKDSIVIESIKNISVLYKDIKFYIFIREGNC